MCIRDSVAPSIELADALLARLEFDSEEREAVLNLIRLHIEMSNALRRDIFDLENVRGFAEKIGSPQMLKMLTLLTYADVKAVNPDALTPWKAENLWQLYMATANFMDRSVDEVRYHAAIDPTLLNRLRSMVPATQHDALQLFLEGLPQRYLQTRLPEQIRNHFQMAAKDVYKRQVNSKDRISARLSFLKPEMSLGEKAMEVIPSDIPSGKQCAYARSNLPPHIGLE